MVSRIEGIALHSCSPLASPWLLHTHVQLQPPWLAQASWPGWHTAPQRFTPFPALLGFLAHWQCFLRRRSTPRQQAWTTACGESSVPFETRTWPTPASVPSHLHTVRGSESALATVTSLRQVHAARFLQNSDRCGSAHRSSSTTSTEVLRLSSAKLETEWFLSPYADCCVLSQFFRLDASSYLSCMIHFNSSNSSTKRSCSLSQLLWSDQMALLHIPAQTSQVNLNEYFAGIEDAWGSQAYVEDISVWSFLRFLTARKSHFKFDILHNTV